MSNNIERQEHLTTDNARVTGDQENPNHIETLEKELQEFLSPETIILTSDITNLDINSLQYIQNLIDARITQLMCLRSKAITEYYTQTINILQSRKASILKSMAESTSPPSTISTKPNENTNKSKTVSE